MKKTRNMLPGRIAKRIMKTLWKHNYLILIHPRTETSAPYETIRRIIKEELEKEDERD
jgi:hypothetical protein